MFLRNIYGERITQQFHCGHDIANDPLILLTSVQSADCRSPGFRTTNGKPPPKRRGRLPPPGRRHSEPRILTMRIDDQDSFPALRPELGTEARDSVSGSPAGWPGWPIVSCPPICGTNTPPLPCFLLRTDRQNDRALYSGRASQPPGPSPGPEGVSFRPEVTQGKSRGAWAPRLFVSNVFIRRSAPVNPSGSVRLKRPPPVPDRRQVPISPQRTGMAGQIKSVYFHSSSEKSSGGRLFQIMQAYSGNLRLPQG